MIKTEHEVYFTRGPCGHRELKTGEPPLANLGRLQRVTKLMALAIRFDQLIRDGIVEDQGEIARLGHVTSARLSQIMGMLSLAPDIQEAILLLPRVHEGRDTVTKRDLRRVMGSLDWGVQRERCHLLSAVNIAKQEKKIFFGGGVCANCIAGISPPAILLLDLDRCSARPRTGVRGIHTKLPPSIAFNGGDGG